MNRSRSGRITLLITLLIGLLLATPSGAQTGEIDDAKRAGQLGERFDGYLGLVNADAPPDVKQLMADINAKRRAKYRRIGQENGIPEKQVALVAGQKLVNRAAAGQYVMPEEGKWVLK